MVSIIIPAREEIYLEKTIRNILDNSEGEIEILIMLDGWMPNPPIHMNDNRVIFIHYPKSIGQRSAINEGVRRAKGEFIMKLDAHCAVDKGFDVKLAADCEPSWTVIPRMYNLDIVTWKPKLHKVTDYMYISSPNHPEKPFRASYYTGSDYHNWHKKSELIDDTMCCMGPCFFMHKNRFWEQGGCDENHVGGWGQQGIEVSLKAWLSGGALKVNKKTWFAHWFRGNAGGFPYKLDGRVVDAARAYSRDLWTNNKWVKQTKNLEWLVGKFKPPTWDFSKNMTNEEYLYSYMFDQRRNNYPLWRGHKVVKYPTDLVLYEQIIWQTKPDYIIECGTAYGGSTLFLADMLDIVGKGKVISIDINPISQPPHPRIEYITGRTTAVDTLEKIKNMVKGSCMVILDSDHSRVHVKRELHYYSKIATKGQYIVVEDCYYKMKKKPPAEAVDWFLRTRRGSDFQMTKVDQQFGACLTRYGWLLKQR